MFEVSSLFFIFVMRFLFFQEILDSLLANSGQVGGGAIKHQTFRLMGGLDLINLGQALNKTRPTMFLFIYNFLNDCLCKGLVCHRLFLVCFFWLRHPVGIEWKEKNTYCYCYIVFKYIKSLFFIDKLMLQVALDILWKWSGKRKIHLIMVT